MIRILLKFFYHVCFRSPKVFFSPFFCQTYIRLLTSTLGKNCCPQKSFRGILLLVKLTRNQSLSLEAKQKNGLQIGRRDHTKKTVLLSLCYILQLYYIRWSFTLSHSVGFLIISDSSNFFYRNVNIMKQIALIMLSSRFRQPKRHVC